MQIKSIRGFKDILPGEVEKWQFAEREARRVFGLFGFSEFRIPVVERTELFVRSIGEATDFVGKEMYTFQDRDGDSITLRPEATASIMRAYLEHGLNVREPVGKYVIHVCDSAICWMHDHQSVIDHIRSRLDVEIGGTTADGLFTLLPVCCIGYCDRAPAMTINRRVFGRLTPAKIDRVLTRLKEVR